MRRNKPQQLGVREGGAACGRRRAGRAGAGGEGPVVPAQVRAEGRRAPRAALAPASSSPLQLSSRPALFYLPTDSVGSFSVCYLGASCLVVTACPRGGAAWGHTRAVGGPDCHRRQFAAFWETGECGQHPHSQQLSLGPHVQGTQPRRHAKKPPWGSFGAPGARCCFLLCVRVGGGAGRARFVWVGMAVVVS